MLRASGFRGFVPLPCLGYIFKAGFYPCVLMRAAGPPASLPTQTPPPARRGFVQAHGCSSQVYVKERIYPNDFQKSWAPATPQPPPLGTGIPSSLPCRPRFTKQTPAPGGERPLLSLRHSSAHLGGFKIASRGPGECPAPRRKPRAASLLAEGEFSRLTTRCPPYPETRPATPHQSLQPELWLSTQRRGALKIVLELH